MPAAAAPGLGWGGVGLGDPATRFHHRNNNLCLKKRQIWGWCFFFFCLFKLQNKPLPACFSPDSQCLRRTQDSCPHHKKPRVCVHLPRFLLKQSVFICRESQTARTQRFPILRVVWRLKRDLKDQYCQMLEFLLQIIVLTPPFDPMGPFFLVILHQIDTIQYKCRCFCVSDVFVQRVLAVAEQTKLRPL